MYKKRMFSWLLGLLVPVAAMARVVVGDSVHTLQDVDVVGVRIAQRMVIGGQRLDGEALRRLDGGSVADALRYFAGVQLKDYGGVGGIKTINIRSMGSQHVGIYYDGVELGNAQNGQIDLGQLSLDNIQEIAVYNGQRSTLLQWLPTSPMGAPSISARVSPTSLLAKPTHLKAKVQAGASGLLSLSTLWEQRLSDRLSVSLSAGWLSASGKYRFRYRLADS